MKVREIMHRIVHTVRWDDTLKCAALLMANNNISLLPVVEKAMVQDNRVSGVVKKNIGFNPVVEEDVLVGVLTSRDITTRAVAYDKPTDATRVSDIMSRDIAFCKEDDEIDTALAIMEAKHVRRLVVFNREGLFVGLVSRHDLWQAKLADTSFLQATNTAS